MTDSSEGVMHDVDCINIVQTETPDNISIREGDLAMLMLTYPIDLSFQSTARAACLPTPEDLNNIPEQVPLLYISGWGLVPEFNLLLPKMLRYGLVPYITNEECTAIYDEKLEGRGKELITDNMLCVGNNKVGFL